MNSQEVLKKMSDDLTAAGWLREITYQLALANGRGTAEPEAPMTCRSCNASTRDFKPYPCCGHCGAMLRPDAVPQPETQHEPLMWGTNCPQAPDGGPHECTGKDTVCGPQHKCLRCGALCLCKWCNRRNPRCASSVSDRLVHTDTPVGRQICTAMPSYPPQPTDASAGECAGADVECKERQRQIAEVEEEVALLEVEATLWPNFYKQQAAYSRIFAREQAALADLKRGMK